MRQVSLSRIDRMKKSGKRLGHNSTIQQMTAEEFNAQREKERAELFEALRLPKVRSPRLPRTYGAMTRKKAVRLADVAFSQFIRLRDAGPDGRVKCVSCPRVSHWRDMDAGHYCSRAKASTRYDEKNASAQCGGCNRFQGGRFIEHGNAIDERYGKGTSEALRIKALIDCKRTTDDLLSIAKSYTERVALIKANEPNKFERAAA